MLVENLIHRFKLEKNHTPLHANELLDYAQKCYIQGELSILEYKKLLLELEKQKAEKPQSYIIKTKPLKKINIPS